LATVLAHNGRVKAPTGAKRREMGYYDYMVT
jgi:hypothetical protein